MKIIDKCLHPFKHQASVDVRGKRIVIKWTRRAEQALQQHTRDQNVPLIIEMQLYFSCTVKKRVLFHDQSDFETIPVNKHFSLAFHPVEASSCDPLEFAKNFPVKRVFDSSGALKMSPSELVFDFKNDQWIGHFNI